MVGQLARLRARLPSRRAADSTAMWLLAGGIAATVLSPLLWLFLRAGEVGRTDAIAILSRPAVFEVLVRSVGLVVVVTTGSILIGVPLAVLTVRAALPLRRFLTVLLALPLVVPSYLGAFAFVSAFGPHGELADLLGPIGPLIPTVYGFAGGAVVLTLYVYPYVFLTTRASLLSVDMTLVEAARTLDHDRWGAFRRVTLPRILPGITAGALLAALYTLSDFGTPAIMHVEVFTQQIFVAYNTVSSDLAALLSLQLLGVTVLILALESRVGRADAEAYAGRPRGTADIDLGRWTFPAVLACLAVATLALVLPIAILLLWLVRGGPGFAGGGFTFHWGYAANSVYVSALAAGVALVAALPVAHLSARRSSRLATLLDRATYVGYAIPGVVLGLALVYFGVAYARVVYQTIPLLVFAYVVRFLPQAVGTTRSSILQVDPALVDAARSLGQTGFGAFRRVTLPLIAPGVVAGAALVFLTTMKELPATLLVRPTGFETIVTYVWLVQEAGYYGQAAVPALVLVVVSGVSMLVILARERFEGRS